jgi:hypothetical protein
LAEKYTADAEYVPGTVLVFGGSAEVTADGTDSERRVAGVAKHLANEGIPRLPACRSALGHSPPFLRLHRRRAKLVGAHFFHL